MVSTAFFEASRLRLLGGSAITALRSGGWGIKRGERKLPPPAPHGGRLLRVLETQRLLLYCPIMAGGGMAAGRGEAATPAQSRQSGGNWAVKPKGSRRGAARGPDTAARRRRGAEKGAVVRGRGKEGEAWKEAKREGKRAGGQGRGIPHPPNRYISPAFDARITAIRDASNRSLSDRFSQGRILYDSSQYRALDSLVRGIPRTAKNSFLVIGVNRRRACATAFKLVPEDKSRACLNVDCITNPPRKQPAA